MNIEGALIAWIGNHCHKQCYSDIPNPRPNEFATVERVGGGLSNIVVDHPSIAVQCWSTTRARASDMAYMIAHELAVDFCHQPHIKRVIVDSVYNFPDPESGNPRYQIVVNLVTA